MRTFFLMLAIGSASQLLAAGFNLDGAVKLLNDKTKKLNTVDDFFGALPPIYHQNYFEVYKSRAEDKEHVSAKYPRIGAYGEDASFLVCVKGNPAHPASFNSVQFMQFKENPPRLELYRLAFPPERDAKGEVKLPAPNPEECTQCHGNPPHMFWDGYFLWPGLNGSEDDEPFLGGIETSKAKTERARRKDGFLAVKDSIGRYKALKEHLDEGAPSGSSYAYDSPNVTFGYYATKINTNIESYALSQNPLMQRYRYAFLAAVTCGSRFEHLPNMAMEDFLPEALRKGFRQSIPDTGKKLAEMSQKSLKLRLERHYLNLGIKAPEVERVQDEEKQLPDEKAIKETPENKEKREKMLMMSEENRIVLTRLKYLADNLGISTKYWSMDKDRLLAINDGVSGFANGMERYLWTYLIDQEKDPDLFAYFKKSGGYLSRPLRSDLFFGGSCPGEKENTVENEGKLRSEICEKLKTKSITALGGKVDPASPKEKEPEEQAPPAHIDKNLPQ